MTTQPSDHPSSLVPGTPALLRWVWIQPSDVLDVNSWQEDNATETSTAIEPSQSNDGFTYGKSRTRALDILAPLRTYVSNLDVRRPQLAHFICRNVPTQCPFERDVKLFRKTLFHIPPLCKLNPLYDEVVELRFRAMCYLADECGEDVTPYC